MYSKIPHQLARYPMSLRAFRLFVYLSSYNPVFPSYTRISKDTGMSRATINEAKKDLIDLGLLEYDRGNSSKKSNLYKLSNKISTTSSKSELVDGDQFKICTSTSSKSELQLVQNLNSNKNNIKKTIKKGELEIFEKGAGIKSSWEVAQEMARFRSEVVVDDAE